MTANRATMSAMSTVSTRNRRALATVAACAMTAGLVVSCTSSDGNRTGAPKRPSTSTSVSTEGTDSSPDPGYTPKLVAAACADPTTDTTTIGCFTLTLPENRDDPTGRQVELPVIRVRSSADPSLGMQTPGADATATATKSTAIEAPATEAAAADQSTPSPPPASPAEAPVVYLHGGPGDGAVDGWLAWRQLIDGIPGEIVAFDQRGGGHANPRLDCPEHSSAVAGTLADHPSWSDARRSIGESIRTCNSRLRTQGIDVSQYNLDALVSDLEDLRKALGVEKMTLLAASYGTRLALAYNESYPQRVKSLILGGVVTADSGGPKRERSMLESALSRLSDACSADRSTAHSTSPGCSTRYPDIEGKLASAAKSLDARPVTLGGDTPVKVTGDELYAGVFGALYETSTIPLVPMVVSRIAAGDQHVWDSIGSQLTPALTGDSAFGAQIGINCSDLAASLAERADTANTKAGGKSGGSTGGSSDDSPFGRTYQKAAKADPGRSRDLVLTGTDSFCDFWNTSATTGPGSSANTGTTDTDTNAEQSNDTVAPPKGSRGRSRANKSLTLALPPALVVAGELDPITPAADSRSTAKRLGGVFLEVRRGGHDAMFTDACARDQVRAFLTALNTGGSVPDDFKAVCPDGAPPPFS